MVLYLIKKEKYYCKKEVTLTLGAFQGAMEIGESAAETAIREIKEETGYDVEINELIGVYTKYFQSYPNGDKAQSIVMCFSCSIVGGDKK